MKRAIWLWGLVILMAALPAMADTIAPSSYSATLGIGGTATVHKTVTVTAGTPTTSLVDVFFLADTTGSMGGTITSVRNSASAILAGAAGLGNVQFGVGEYRDVGDAFVYQMNQAITANTAAVQSAINGWVAGGGGDTPEAQLYALQTVAGAATGWRTGSARLLVWMGDQPGHDPSYLGATQASATAALQAANIKVEAMNVGNLNGTGQASAIAAATGGQYFGALSSASIVTAIQNAITTAFATYTTVSLDLSEVGPNVTATMSPAAFVGAYDRSIARTFDFDVTFTGVSPGTASFDIFATVDGGRVATESDRITVTSAVPEPGAIVLFGTLLAGIAGVMRRRAR